MKTFKNNILFNVNEKQSLYRSKCRTLAVLEINEILHIDLTTKLTYETKNKYEKLLIQKSSTSLLYRGKQYFSVLLGAPLTCYEYCSCTTLTGITH